jgi:hypothetical protein
VFACDNAPGRVLHVQVSSKNAKSAVNPCLFKKHSPESSSTYIASVHGWLTQTILDKGVVLFVVKNRNEFTLNSEIHEINTRQQGNCHLPLANLTKYQKGIYYIGTKVYNNLPLYIKAVSKDLEKFEEKLK